MDDLDADNFDGGMMEYASKDSQDKRKGDASGIVGYVVGLVGSGIDKIDRGLDKVKELWYSRGGRV